jgi:hypothetical protein
MTITGAFLLLQLNAVESLARFPFGVDDAAPIADPYTDSTGDTLTEGAQTNNVFAVSGGAFVMDSNNTSYGVDEDYVYTTETFDDAAGLIVKLSDFSIGGGAHGYGIQLVDAARANIRTGIVVYSSVVGLQIDASPGAVLATDKIDLGIDTASDVAFVFVAADMAALLAKIDGSWRLRGVYPVLGATTTHSVEIHHRRSDGASIGELDVNQMSGSWATDYGVATSRVSGAVSAGTTFEAESDHVGYVADVNTISGTAKVFKFRQQDANNYLRITADSTSTDFDEVVAGTPTQRATGAALANDSDLEWRVEDAEFEMWSVGVSLGSYSSALYTAATGAEFDSGADVGTMTIFPYTLTGVNAGQVENI